MEHRAHSGTCVCTTTIPCTLAPFTLPLWWQQKPAANSDSAVAADPPKGGGADYLGTHSAEIQGARHSIAPPKGQQPHTSSGRPRLPCAVGGARAVPLIPTPTPTPTTSPSTRRRGAGAVPVVASAGAGRVPSSIPRAIATPRVLRHATLLPILPRAALVVAAAAAAIATAGAAAAIIGAAGPAIIAPTARGGSTSPAIVAPAPPTTTVAGIAGAVAGGGRRGCNHRGTPRLDQPTAESDGGGGGGCEG
jgi:hypothetical protein